MEVLSALEFELEGEPKSIAVANDFVAWLSHDPSECTVWYIHDDTPRAALDLPRPATAIAASSTGGRLGICDTQGFAVIKVNREGDDYSLLGNIPLENASLIAFDPSGDTGVCIGGPRQSLVCSFACVPGEDADNNVKRNDLSMTCIVDCTPLTGDRPLRVVTVSPRHAFLISEGNVMLRIDLTKGASSVTCGGAGMPASSATCAIFDPRNGVLFVGAEDGSIRIYSETLVMLQTLALLRRDSTVSNFAGVGVLTLDIRGEYLIVCWPGGTALLQRDSRAVMGREDFESPCCGAAMCGGVEGLVFPDRGTLTLRTTALPHAAVAQAPAVQQIADDPTRDWITASVAVPGRMLAPLPVVPAPLVGSTKLPSKPVTFGHRIRSSGYSAQPWSVQQKHKKVLAKQASKSFTPPPLPKYEPGPPPGRDAPEWCPALKSTPLSTGAIIECTFTATGQAFVTASLDGTVGYSRLSQQANQPGVCLSGHTAPVQTLDCAANLQHPLVASGSSDGVVALWRPSTRDKPYVLHSVGKDVKAVRFLYNDKLLAVATGPKVSLFKYAVDDGGDDLHRGRNTSRLVEAHQFTSAAQAITGLACINFVTSTLLAWVGSNRQFGVYDIATGQDLRVIDDAHTKPIHTVAMQSASRYVDVGSDALHTVLTGSFDSTVRVWDLRRKSPVRTLIGFPNTSLKVGLCLTPCGRFAMVGGEDRHMYTFDLCTGSVLSRLPAGETVSAIAAHPTQPLVLAATTNGVIRFFK